MNILIAIIVLGVLIFVHELGHFLVAKLCGVYVERFSLGFGPRILSKTIGETEYCLSVFPLGGYVKMYGEQQEDNEQAPEPAKEGRAFTDKKTWQRAAIILAGPLANVLLAVVVFWGLFMSGFPDYAAVIGNVKESSPAQIAGLAAGDEVVAVNGDKVRGWSDFQEAVIENPNKTLSIELADGRTLSVNTGSVEATDVFGDKEVIGSMGVSLYVPAVIGSVNDGFPAKAAGIESGDKIIAINGEKITDWSHGATFIRENSGETLTIDLDRNGEAITVNVDTKVSEIVGENGETVKIGLIGITSAPGNVNVRYGFFESMIKGFEKSYEFTVLVFKGFAKLLQRAVPADSLGGPIMIVQMTADSAQSGLAALLTFMAIISLNLAVFNLLPIPVLDGGHLLIMLIETITRRKLNEKVIGAFQTVGFVLLMGLMVFAFYNDIARIFTN